MSQNSEIQREAETKKALRENGSNFIGVHASDSRDDIFFFTTKGNQRCCTYEGELS